MSEPSAVRGCLSSWEDIKKHGMSSSISKGVSPSVGRRQSAYASVLRVPILYTKSKANSLTQSHHLINRGFGSEIWRSHRHED